MIAFIKGNSNIPERLWNKAVAETEAEIVHMDSLKTEGWRRASFHPKTKDEAIKWINR